MCVCIIAILVSGNDDNGTLLRFEETTTTTVWDCTNTEFYFSGQ